uniref:LsmAD domain-containing protein n=1 Tax=Panagrolaimus sp. ES5 TaxID=591445 RepID=A0AC34GSE9_9BILA
MKKSDNNAQRMNSNNGEGSSSSKKISKSKSRRSGESSGGKPQPNTSIKASYVGRDVEVRLKNSKIVHGICVNPGLDTVFKLHNAYVTPGAGFEPYVYSKNVHHPELQLPIQDIVDVKTTLGNPKKKFATDGEYSTNQNDNDANFKLVQWDCGESSEQPLDQSTSRGGGGWSVEEMFKKNEDLGVQTTFKDDLTQYTTCEPVGSEEDKMRAAQIAREIETNDKSKHLAFLENDDEERDLDKETSLPDGTEEKDQTNPQISFANQEDNTKKKFQFNPDAPAFVPKPFAPAQSAQVGVVSVQQHPPLMPQPPIPNNNQPQQFFVAQNVAMQPSGSVVTSTYMPQQIPVMPIYNHQLLNNAQSMQAIPSLIQTHPQNIIIRGEYPNAYIQGNPASIQLQHMPVYRMALPVQPPQQQQQQHHQTLSQPQHQPITVYQIQPQVTPQQHYNQIIHQQPQQLLQQQQHQPRHMNHYSSGGNNYGGNNGGGGGGRTRKNNNHHGNNNNNWHQNSQSTSQHQPQHVNQPRYQQVLPQTPVYMSQMGHVYVNQNAAITSSSGNNMVHSNVVPINMIPQQYAMPQQIYQRIDANNMNGMVAVQQAQQLPQNTIRITPLMGTNTKGPRLGMINGGPPQQYRRSGGRRRD